MNYELTFGTETEEEVWFSEIGAYCSGKCFNTVLSKLRIGEGTNDASAKWLNLTLNSA